MRRWAVNNFDGAAWQFHDLPAALAHVQQLLVQHAPIDGVLGMSQGGMIAQVVGAQSCSGEGSKLQFAICCGGVKPGWAAQRPDLFPEAGLQLHSFIVSGAQDTAQIFADPGCRTMASLVAPGYVARHTHADGHTVLPRNKKAASALADELCDFMLHPAAVVAQYPAREMAREAAARAAAEQARIEDERKRMGGDMGMAALEAAGIDTTRLFEAKEEKVHDSLPVLLNEHDLGFLKPTLAADGRSLTDWCALAAKGGKAEVMKGLKQAGVDKFGERQKLASLLVKAAKGV